MPIVGHSRMEPAAPIHRGMLPPKVSMSRPNLLFFLPRRRRCELGQINASWSRRSATRWFRPLGWSDNPRNDPSCMSALRMLLWSHDSAAPIPGPATRIRWTAIVKGSEACQVAIRYLDQCHSLRTRAYAKPGYQRWSINDLGRVRGLDWAHNLAPTPNRIGLPTS
jgi:hypothetical protein